jgi:hypothetical protein
MRLPILALALCTSLAGCALPKLPALPSLGQIKDTVAPTSEGETAREAVAIAAPVAQAWSADVLLVDVRGAQIDTGGRDHGLDGGQWLVEYQSAAKKKKYAVRVRYKKDAIGSEAPLEDGQTPLDATLAGLLDSPEAINKAGLGAKSYTVILRGSPDGARYDLVGEGSVNAATLDARTGNKL